MLEEGIPVGRDRVLKYMKILDIKGIYPCQEKPAPIQNSENQRYSYLLDKYWSKAGKTKILHISNVNDFWSGDIIYIRNAKGFV